eukprot:Em0004g589a
MSTQSYHVSKQVLISAAKAFMDECKSTGIVPDQTVQSISKGTFNVRKEIGLKKKRAEIKRLRRKMHEEKREREMSAAKEMKLRSLETSITTMMSNVSLGCTPPAPPFGRMPTATGSTILRNPFGCAPPPSPPAPKETSTSTASSFDDSVLDPDYTPTPAVRDERYL